MKFNIKKTANWFMIIIVAAIAFQAGSNLRENQYFHLPQKQSLHASALLKLTPEWDPVQVGQSTAADTEDRQLFRNVFNLLKAHYVDPVTPEMETAMARGAVKGMVESFGDPDNRFMDPTERKLLDDAGNGRFYGIGAILTIKQEKINKPGDDVKPAAGKPKPDQLDVIKIIVVAPMPGSPAEKAGLKPGDSITDIDGKWIITSDPFLMANLDKLSKAVRNKELDEFEYQKVLDNAEKKLKDGMEISQALEMLTARSSGNINIKVDRNGIKKPLEFSMACTETYSDPVVFRKLDSKLEYIKVSQFSKSAASEFSSQISRAMKDNSKGLVLDLRNNPGGLISSGAGITSHIMGGGTLGTVIETTQRRVIKIPKSDKFTKPVVVLINNGTASVAELVAASLSESGYATLVGTRTFGDSLTQTPLTLKDGSSAIITTGRMITSKGTDFNNKGIIPQRYVPDSSTTEDSQLAEAQRILLAKSGKV